MESKALIIKAVTESLLAGSSEQAVSIITDKYPFTLQKISYRKCNIHEKMNVFIRDGFTDRYSGDKLVNPGILKILSSCFPMEFPYHPHWKMTEGHIAYWELSPTIDHLVPIAAGGRNDESNWITTSMLHNSIKSNWTVEQMGWKLHAPCDIQEWDGLTGIFLKLVDADKELLKDSYINNWYRATKRVRDMFS